MGFLPGVGGFEMMVVSVAGLLLFRRELARCLRNLRLVILDLRDTLFRW
jgi:hypothetical protein